MASIDELIKLSRAQAGTYDGPDNGGPNPGGNLMNIFNQVMGRPDPAAEKAKMEKMEKQASMYRTLRQSGYDPAQAHKAVTKATEFPDVPGGETQEELENKRKSDSQRILDDKRKKETEKLGQQIDQGPKPVKPPAVLEQIKAKIASGGYESLNDGEKKIYDDHLRKSGGNSLSAILAKGAANSSIPEIKKPDQAGVKTGKPAKLQDRILAKIADSGYDSLTPGEKKVYDDVIKKQSGGSAGKTGKTGKAEKIAVYDPQGNPGFVPADKLEKALSKGYKLR